jgi:hypothetical protein
MEGKISRYASTLSILDKYAEEYKADWPQDSTTNFNDHDAIWRLWFGDNLDDAQPLLHKARNVFDEGHSSLTFRVQHGDLTPWQMFELGDEWIIYDGEKAGDHLPRYNDLAYGYSRLYTRLKDPATAAKLLKELLKYSEIDHSDFFRQFMPVMMLRATCMLADAYKDRTHDDYYKDAVALINLCFEKELSKFLPSESS